MRTLLSLVLLLCTNIVCASGLQVQIPEDLKDEAAKQAYKDAVLDGALDAVNELSSRRRSNILFPNEQSPFYGVQMNYVNVSKGNLTFLTRDKVVVDRMPLVVGRVYDSSKTTSEDFGPGWKLSFVEQLEKVGETFFYRDSTNSEYKLLKNGRKLYSEYPHLTGIEGGLKNGPSITLTVNGLQKLFTKYKSKFLLTRVSHENGSYLELSYKNSLLHRVVSGSGRVVTIKRNEKGLIKKIKIDGGQEVKYNYNEQGLLSELTDLSGSKWVFKYSDTDILAKIVDPRNIAILKVSSNGDGKISRVKSQSDNSVFEYKKRSTKVTNSLSQTAKLWHHETGLTSAARDWSGTVSQLNIDRDLTVSSLSYNEKAFANLHYNKAGNIAKIVSPNNPATNQVFEYDTNGNLIATTKNGEAFKKYQYDHYDRVISALDEKGVRGYGYNEDGDLNALSFNGKEIGFKTDDIGQIIRLEADGHTLALGYDNNSKVIEISNAEDGVSSKGEFNYSPNGLRSYGRYALAKEDQQVTADYHMNYDDAANFTEITIVAADGGEGSIKQKLKIGARNELLKVTGSDGETLFSYDKLGRPKSIDTPGRNVQFQYDTLGRLSDVYMDSEHIVSSNYKANDPDPAIGSDERTPYTYINSPLASYIYGDLESIAYTRIKGTPYGAIRFDADMARFLISDNGVPSPDAVTYDSLRRRNLILKESAEAMKLVPMLGFDKPSNVLFISPEYFGVNCLFGCLGSVSGYVINPIANTTVGQPVTITSSASTSTCVDISHPMIPFIPRNFVHNLSFGDGQSSLIQSSNASFSLSKTYSSAGNYTVSDVVRCTCNPLLTLASASRTASVVTPSISITVPSSLTLLDNYSVSTNLTPSSVSASNYHFEIKRNGSSTWYTLQNGQTDTFSDYAKVAGNFKVRATVTIDNATYTSSESSLTMNFPDFNRISADSSVASAVSNSWSSILNATTSTSRREEGFWIQLNTNTRSYEIGSTILGAVVPNNTTATLTPGPKPSDSNSSPTPLDTVTYTVAFFHGHTPTRYRNGTRPIGPSSADNTFHSSPTVGVVGLVADYIESPSGSGSIPPFYNLNGPWMIYHSGPQRRSTPQ
ncbi:DUF6531 domain-containing protein [Porticoccus sp. W117]|uniref:DUF6531 domain-containing protein n=1 Tax=Porticoccus sp. W117 TaxID=3054777 RepID=UPI00259461D1|nr:DUF6531 domain-containing protein [Porticoccus sp. W117]MDM3871408.1 DUF6531 domain-containing protein [Porticoccus sp. W117]